MLFSKKIPTITSTWKIFDLDENEILEGTTDLKHPEIPLQKLQPGTYKLEFATGEQRSAIKIVRPLEMV
ncbi:MAG: hypothetical protein IT265_02005 [Saprospiraceae bacterium]|nr:hypothetical protein [Saprospiraceae bacterium]